VKNAPVFFYLLIAVFFVSSKSWAPDESTNPTNPYQVSPPAPTTATESAQTSQGTNFYSAALSLVNGGELTPAFFTALAVRLAAIEKTDDAAIEKITTELISQSFPAGSKDSLTQWPDPDFVSDLHPAVLRGMAKKSTAEAVRKFAEQERGRSSAHPDSRSKFYRFYMRELADLKSEFKDMSISLLIEAGLISAMLGTTAFGLRAIDADEGLVGTYLDPSLARLGFFGVMAAFTMIHGYKWADNSFAAYELRRQYRLLSETVEPPVVQPTTLSQRCVAAARRLVHRK
jgi:hypothetical protein